MRPADEIERLLGELTDETSSAFDEHTVRDMFSAQGDNERMRPARSWRDIGRAIMESRMGRIAAAAVLVLAVLLVAKHLSGREAMVEPQEPTIAADPQNDDNIVTTNVLNEQEQQLHLAAELYEQSDVPGLLGLLETGSDETQVAVAGYLGQLGDASALPALRMLASQWQGMPEDNPFARSIERIGQAVTQAEPIEDESAAQEPEPESLTATGNDHIRMVLEVSEKETGRPIRHAAIRTTIAGQTETREANEQGVFILDLGESMPSYANISVRLEGYVRQDFSTQGRTRQSLPRTLRFSLEKAVVVGGVVQDSEGHPVAGASVEGHYSGHQVQQFDEPQMTISFKQTTDVEGRWWSDNVPAEIDELWFNVCHGDFADGGFSMPRDLSLADLQSQRAVMILEAGISVVGTVTDTSGNPIAGATLLANEDYFGRDWAETDANGVFEFRNLSPINASFPLTVWMPGFTPQRRELARKPGLAPVDFVLKAATPLVGRVVDANGAPLEGAYVVTENWGQFRTLKWDGRTDSDGLFVWDYPPDDAIEIRISKSGYQEYLRAVVPDGTERTFVLLKPMVIKGTVTDRETGEPIPRFKVTPGIDWIRSDESVVAAGGMGGGRLGGSRARWQANDSHTQWFTGGQFSYTFTADGSAYAVRIEADGYLPVESRFVDATEQEVAIDLVMTKGQGPSGYVFDANAVPVAGADVFWQDNNILRNGDVTNKSQAEYVKTDANGYFAFPPQDKSDPLLVLCDYGVGAASYQEFARDGIIMLTPWARVQGELLVGTHLARNVQLQLFGQTPLPADLGTSECVTATDEQGQFVFERVYPGMIWLYNQTYQVAPGQILELTLGGTGCTVQGRLDFSSVSDVPYFVSLGLSSISEPLSFDELPKPPGYEDMGYAEVQAWTQGPGETPAARLRRVLPQVPSLPRLQVDGDTFHIDNVEPGKYAISGIVYYDGRTHGLLGRIWHEFEILPAADLDQLDVPVDIGMVSMQPYPLEPGTPAPGLNVPSLAGGRIDSADYAGRVLLVSFHSTVSRPDSSLVAALRKLHERFGADRRFALVGLLVTNNVLADKKASEGAALEWPVGYVNGRDSKEMCEYAVPNWPWHVLIGPDGTILAAGVPTEELEQTVEAALASLP